MQKEYEEEINDKMPNIKKMRVQSQSSDDDKDDTDQEQKMIEDLEKLTQVKKVEHSTLKMGYNEEDFIIQRTESPNCIHEYIAPKGYERDAKWKRPLKQEKEYKFKLDTF